MGYLHLMLTHLPGAILLGQESRLTLLGLNNLKGELHYYLILVAI